MLETDSYLAFCHFSRQDIPHREFVHRLALQMLNIEKSTTQPQPAIEINVTAAPDHSLLPLLSHPLYESKKGSSTKKARLHCVVCSRVFAESNLCSFYCKACSDDQIGFIMAICGHMSERGSKCYLYHLQNGIPPKPTKS
eukprot:Pompholyxophrys_punicea_v1_NODE_1327_length_788_cov_2.712142.p1 type:complete len:140 gc:universal NODE_1327_length_788_cov_2.712142:614-195(-)